MNEETLDETFEIISLREKYLKDQLALAEDSLMKSEFNVLINKDIIKITTAEIKLESEKNSIKK